MAEDKDDEQDDELDDELDDDDEDESSEGGGRKKLFIIIGAVLLLAVGGAAAAYFTGLMEPLTAMLTGDEGSGAAGEDGNPSGSIVFHDLPEIVINLNTGGRKSSYLKIRISLELASAADIPKIEGVMPRVIDNFQVYLRELRIEDLKGSAGMYRLREELLMRVSAAAAPAKVNDVLFKEMIVQ